jgi:A/G-specific adenine glycosylase
VVCTSLSSQESDKEIPFASAEVARRLLSWYGRQGRDLPWRGTRDPYRVWLAEIMLQQTTVDAVILYYERFLGRFADVGALAAASVDEVLTLWAGLGYYARARNLHAAARQVVEQHSGSFPDSLEGLQGLPGVGRSTAGAILSIAFDRPAPILDGNVRRVLSRLFALQENPRGTAAEKKLWRWAEALTPADCPHDYAQAIMDLGATVCAPRQPQCSVCPLEGLCRARALGLERQLPLPAVRKKVPEVVQAALLWRDSSGRFRVCRRPYHGLLGGMWEFPTVEIADGEDPALALRRFLQQSGVAAEPEEVARLRHVYSHFRLDLRLFGVVAPAAVHIAESDHCRWLEAEELSGLALHGAHKKALPYLDQVA